MRGLIAGIVAGVLPAGALGACACPPEATAFPMSESEWQTLLAANHYEYVLPEATCQNECSRLAHAADGGSTYIPPAEALHRCELGEVTGGPRVLICWIPPPCIGGRRPAGWDSAIEPPTGSEAADVGAWFARLAHLEAASIDAFIALHRALRRFDAPRELLRDSARAARDEVRHAQRAASLAARFGRSVHTARTPARIHDDRFTLALDNTVEGCVRETFGAAIAAWQAACVDDDAVRDAMREIADDEAAHAALAWRVHAWLAPQLDDDDRERLAAARRRAVDLLRAESGRNPGEPLRRDAGLPTAREACAVIDALDRALWRA